MLLLVQLGLLALAGLFSFLWIHGSSGPVDLIAIIFVMIVAQLVGMAEALDRRRSP